MNQYGPISATDYDTHSNFHHCSLPTNSNEPENMQSVCDSVCILIHLTKKNEKKYSKFLLSYLRRTVCRTPLDVRHRESPRHLAERLRELYHETSENHLIHVPRTLHSKHTRIDDVTVSTYHSNCWPWISSLTRPNRIQPNTQY